MWLRFRQRLRRSTPRCGVDASSFFMCVVCERRELTSERESGKKPVEIEARFRRVIPLLKDFQRARYNEMSELQIYRRTYIPPLPTILTKDVEVKKCEALGAAGDHGSFVDDIGITGR